MRKMNEEELAWLAKFDKEYYGRQPEEEAGKELRAARVKDIYANASLTAYYEDWYTEGELPEGVRSIHVWLDPRRPRLEDAIIDKIDKERGRFMSQDVSPGIIKVQKGYKASHKGESARFQTYTEALTWLQRKKVEND